MCWLFHKWSKWKLYEETGTVTALFLKRLDPPVPYSEVRQRRVCERCGKVQDEWVR